MGLEFRRVLFRSAGGMFVQFGPTLGAIVTLMMAELLRVYIGTDAVGLDNAIYGVSLVLFIIFLRDGILGSIQKRFASRA